MLIIHRKYVLVEKLYEGAKSVVYRGYDRSTEPWRPVVMKLLHRDYPTAAELASFKQEYQLTKEASAEGVIQCIALEEYGNSLVMIFEDMAGSSLEEHLTEEPVGLEEFLSLAIKIAEALAQIHQRRIIHKNLNPQNIIWNRQTNRVEIIDFGIASKLSREEFPIRPSPSLEGNVYYMSPEQTGRMGRGLDYRTDLYSLGATFYRMLCGRPPFLYEDIMEVVHGHIAKKPVSPSIINRNIPQILSDVVTKLLAKTAEERYQSSSGLASDLKKLLTQFQTRGMIDTIALGKEDLQEKFQLSQKLYGRKVEREMLVEVLERARSGKQEIMLVTGRSGLGKTSLILEIKKHITMEKGYFISGKYEQFKQDIPYFGIVQAFRELMAYLLAETEERLEVVRRDLLSALGQSGQVIIEVVPELELIIGPQPHVEKLDPDLTRNRFNMAFRKFVQTLATNKIPLVMFLDDLHWADRPSLKLLAMLVSDSEISNFFVVGAYRDNEVHPSHPLIVAMEEMEKSGVRIHSIALKPLEVTHVAHLLEDSFELPGEEVTSMAHLCMEKTLGNPLFIVQLLTLLYREGTIHFDYQSRKWTWDLRKIQEISPVDDITALLRTRLKNLSVETQSILQMAACIGLSFSLKNLSVVLDKPFSEVFRHLRQAEREQLIVSHVEDFPINVETDENINVSFRFLHDHIHQAAYNLVGEERAKKVHLRIGRALLEKSTEENLEEMILHIVTHLNRGSPFITDQEERDKLARLNHAAGLKAKASAGYLSAYEFFMSGIRLLGEDGWKRAHDLMLTLHDEAAESAYAASDHEEVGRILEELKRQDLTPLQQARGQSIRILSMIAQGKFQEVLETGRRFLEQLGVKLPSKPRMRHVILEFMKTKAAFRKKTDEDLLSLEPMHDALGLARSRILTNVSSAAYFYTPMLYPLIAMKRVRLALHYGIDPSTSISALSAYGLFLSSMGDIEMGYRLGQIALSLLERSPIKIQKTRVLLITNWFLKPWKEHLKHSSEPLLEAYHSRIETGDMEYAAHSANAYNLILYFMGAELESIEKEQDTFYKAIKALKQQMPSGSIGMVRQVTVNLMEDGDLSTHISGTFFDEEEMLPNFMEEGNRSNICMFYIWKLYLNFLAGQYEEALANAEMAQKYLDGLRSTFFVPFFYMYSSLTRLGLCERAPRAIRSAFLKKVRKNQKKMRKWATHAPMNFLNKWHLVEAERGRILGRHASAEEHYDKAAALAEENGFLHEKALAYELATKYWFAKEKKNIAAICLNKATYAYERWGAKAKINHLKKEYSVLVKHLGLEGPGVFGMVCSSLKGVGEGWDLDLMTVLKASQAISQEMSLKKLVHTLLSIILENAGAQKGLLALASKGKWVVEQTMSLESSADLESFEPVWERNRHFSASIIDYVHRTGKSVVLGNAFEDPRFRKDPYIAGAKPKSILCLPIARQGKVIGILYLENNLASEAFTPHRVTLLEMLCTQSAISLENSSLYEELEKYSYVLERKVAERTASLKAANVALKDINRTLQGHKIELEKAKRDAELANQHKSEFLAHMSHEIRTPMNAVLGYCGLAMKTDMTCKQRDYLNKIDLAARSLIKIVNEILDFSKIEAGKMSLEEVEFSLHEVIGKVTSMMGIEASEKGIEVIYLIDGRIPSRLIGDPLRLGQVLLNLTSNAVKFTPSGYVALKARLESMDHATCTVHFSVMDTGIGMTEDELSKVFKAFSQADPSVCRRFGGTGLGLAISRRLVELMGGTIDVVSGPGKGSIFSFSARFGHQDLKDKEIRRSEEETVCFDGSRVLVVDDNELNRQLAREILENAGIEVDTVDNGEKAIAALERRAYDAVLMDIQMPVVGGYEATVLIRRNPRLRDLPIIALTAYYSNDDKEACLSSGMNAYVSKPIDPEELLRVLKEWVKVGRAIQKSPAEDRSSPLRKEGPVKVSLPVRLPGIDIGGGLKRVVNNRDTYLDLLTRFREMYSGLPTELEKMIGEGRHKEARHVIHSLKGISGNLSLTKVFKIAHELEEFMSVGGEDPRILLSHLEKVLDEVYSSICILESFREDKGSFSGTPIDRSSMFSKIADMIRLLKEGNPDSEIWFEEIGNYLSHGLSESEYGRLKNLIRNYDYDEALSVLDAINASSTPEKVWEPEPLSRPQIQQTILIVDDDPVNIRILREILHSDYSIRVAKSGQKTLQIAQSDTPPDLILLDAEMPGMDGYEVCRKLKESPVTASIPVIFVTARGSEEDEYKGFKVGALDYIVKPYSPELVRARVKMQMELKKNMDILASLSTVDGLTGVANRRRFDDYLTTTWNLSIRDGSTLSLIMIDIDSFKSYNDIYGHQAGDECLRKVAKALSECLKRKTDLIARYGGEEFACILPGTDEKGATEVAQSFQRRVLELGIAHSGGQAAPIVTISQGVATLKPGKDQEASLLVVMADKALYEAKAGGRNRIAIAP